MERNLAGVPHSREFRMGPDYIGAHCERQSGVAKQLFGAMGITCDEQTQRQDRVLRSFRQFDAPMSIVITYDLRSTAATSPPLTAVASSTPHGHMAWAP